MIKRRIIAFFVLIALFIVPVAVFADIPINIPSDAWEYWVVFSNGDYYYLIASNNPIIYSVYDDRLYANTCQWYELSSDGNWFLRQEEPRYWVNFVFDQIYASNHDIAKSDDSGFFFTPPKASVLFRTMQRVDSGILLTSIFHGLIPLVGLIVLGISLKKVLGFLLSRLTH